MAKKTTLEDLARITQRGFFEVNKKIDERTDGLREEMNQGFSDVQKEMEGLATKDGLRAFALNWAAEIVTLQDIVKNLSQRITVLEHKRRK